MITINLSLHSNDRGNGFWKLNTSLVSESGYVDEIKLIIQSTADEYKDDESVNPIKGERKVIILLRLKKNGKQRIENIK